MRLETFFENFELLADAPNGLQKLRELILQLAVRGKLVPQDPNDEPATVLFEKIKAEKEWLVKEKKIQKPKPLQSVEVEELSFEIPDGWQSVRLGCIYEFAYGKSLPEKARNQKGQVPVYGSNGIVGYHDESLVTQPSLIVGRKGSSGAVNLANEPFWPIDTTYYVTPPKGINLIFSYYLLRSLNLRRFDKSTAIPGLNRQDAYALLIGLPPKEEQKRIVAKVDRLMALCDELETRQQKKREGCVRLNNTAIAQLLTTREPDDFSKHWQRICDNFDLLYSVPENIGKLRQAILQLAVQGKLVPQNPNDEPASVLLEKIKAEKEWLVKEGKINKSKPLPPIKPDEEPYALPSGWAWVRIDDFYEVVGGIQKTPKRKPVSHYFPYLRVANVYRGKLELSEITYFEIFENELQRWKLKAGDLLIVEGNGSENEIGRCAVWNEELENCVHQNHLIRGKPIGHKGELFTLLFLNSPDGMSEMKRLAITTSGLYSLSVGKIRGIVVPLPPLLEQQRIIRKVDQLMSLCDELEAKLTQSQTDSEKLMDAVVRQVLTA